VGDEVNYYDMLPGLRRIVIGFLLAVILAALVSIASAVLHAEGQKPKPAPAPAPTTQAVIVPPYTAFCDWLDPYSEAWFFWNCQAWGGK
jgi:hypothetical protein